MERETSETVHPGSLELPLKSEPFNLLPSNNHSFEENS